MIDPCATAVDYGRQQLLLLAWFSPSFPIGAFAFSHGLEWAHECGAVSGRSALETWIGDILEYGSGRQDAILISESWRADQDGYRALVELGAALQPSRERYLEASVQGQAFLQMIRTAYPASALEGVAADLDSSLSRLTLPVAVGLCAAIHRVSLTPLLTAYLGGFVANLCSAAVRLGIVGQTDGQRVIAALHPVVLRMAAETQTLTLDDLGNAALRSDLFSLQHETQYSRLFRS